MNKMRLEGIYRLENHDQVYIIELFFNESPDQVDLGQITQESIEIDRMSWQAPYDEIYLNEAGDKMIGDSLNIPENCNYTRILFFFHYLDFKKPLLTHIGNLDLTNPISIPDRLKNLIIYNKPD